MLGLIDDKLPEGYVILCKAKDEEHTFLVRRLGLSVECPKCGSTALSTDLADEFWLRKRTTTRVQDFVTDRID